MATLRRTFIFLCWLICFSGSGFLQGASALGVNYGQLGDNLLPPEKVVELLSSHGIRKTKIYDTNPRVLSAFANSGIELIVTVENRLLGELSNPQAALQWVQTHVKPYVPATKITSISVGNEVDAAGLLDKLVPAMSSIQAALSQLRLDSSIKVSSPLSYGVIKESYPPSAGSFRSEVSDVMRKLLQFLETTKAPFWINVYPYFAYQGNSDVISLDYALLKDSSTGFTDPSTKLHYDNMLYAQVDAINHAITKLGFNDIEVKVRETGWPSKGSPNEIGASVENAAAYNGNLVRRQLANEGTPLKKAGLEVYVFALFNENQKPGLLSEKNFGLFQPDGTMAYNVGLPRLSSTSTYDLPSPSSEVSTGTARNLRTLTVVGLMWVLFFFFLLFEGVHERGPKSLKELNHLKQE